MMSLSKETQIAAFPRTSTSKATEPTGPEAIECALRSILQKASASRAINRRVDWLCQLLMQEAEQGCPSGRAYFEHLANAVVIAVAAQIEPRLPDAGNPEAQHRAIAQAIALMDANFASKLTRDEAARAAGLSPFHFSRIFRQLVGVAPHHYLLRCRLRHALKLLSTDEARSIADVAAEAGLPIRRT